MQRRRPPGSRVSRRTQAQRSALLHQRPGTGKHEQRKGSLRWQQPGSAGGCLGTPGPCTVTSPGGVCPLLYLRKETALRDPHSRALAEQGIATLRFDFTGLGESEGDFGRGGFSSSVADIVAAVHWMQSTIGMPALLVGHSLGGTAAIAAAARLDGIRAVCTLGAPRRPTMCFVTRSDQVRRGWADPGRPGRPGVRIAPAFIEELQAQAHENPVKGLRAALLVMHAPSRRGGGHRRGTGPVQGGQTS